MTTSTLNEFLACWEPAYGGTWEACVAGLLDDEDEREIIGELRAVLVGGGRFREPIRVIADDGTVGNGCHRVAAHILEQSATVEWTDQWPDVQPGHDLEVLVAGPLPDELVERIWGRIRSFPLDADTWVESDVLSKRPDKTDGGDVIAGIWSCPLERRGELEDALRDRIAALGCCVIEIREAVPVEEAR